MSAHPGHKAETIDREISRVASEIATRHAGTQGLAIAAIADGGIAFSRLLAERVGATLGCEIPCGNVDILFHRDDLSLRPIAKINIPTDLPYAVEDRTIVLVDDVLDSGRTARAAINEIFDQGRPAAIEFAVVVDRCSPRLPIQARYACFREAVAPGTKIDVRLDTSAHAIHYIVMQNA